MLFQYLKMLILLFCFGNFDNKLCFTYFTLNLKKEIRFIRLFDHALLLNFFSIFGIVMYPYYWQYIFRIQIRNGLIFPTETSHSIKLLLDHKIRLHCFQIHENISSFCHISFQKCLLWALHYDNTEKGFQNIEIQFEIFIVSFWRSFIHVCIVSNILFVFVLSVTVKRLKF